MSGPLPNLDDLEAEWAEFMHDRPGPRKGWSQDQKWRADNPGKLAQLLTYRDGGPRPDFLGSQPGAPERRMVEHLDAWHEAREEQPPSSGQFGADLEAHCPLLSESPGAVVNVSTLAQIRDAFANAPLGSKIRATALIDLQDSDLTWNRPGGPDLVTMYEPAGRDAGVRNGRIYVAGGSYLRIRNDYRPGDLRQSWEHLKLTSGAHHIELDGFDYSGIRSSGILTSGGARDFRFRNGFLIRNGQTKSGYDHGMYLDATDDSTTGQGSVLESIVAAENGGYQFQLYSSPRNLIGAGLTWYGPIGYPPGDVQGGTVLEGAEDVLLVGCIGAWAPNVNFLHRSATGNRAVGCLGWAGGESNFSGWGASKIACVEADPLFVNRNTLDLRLQAGSPAKALVPVEYHGWLPATDILGRARVTADAGAYAA